MIRQWLRVLGCLALVGCAGGGGRVGAGNELRAKGDLSGALAQYSQAVKQEPNNVEAQTALGEVLVDLKRYDEASTTLEKARELGGGERATVALAASKSGQGLYDEASAMMDDALKRSPTADNYLKAAQIKLRARKPIEATPYIDKASALDSKNLDIKAAAGRAASMQGDHDKAIATLEPVLKQYKRQGAAAAEMEVALASSYVAKGRLDEAYHSYRHAASLDSRNADAQAGYAGMMRERGDIEGAITLLKSAESKNPKSAAVQYQLGLAYRDFKLRPQALAALQNAVKLDPGFAEAYPALIAMMDEDKAPTDKLYDTLESAAARAPDDYDTQMRFAKLAEGKKQYVKAAVAYERAVHSRPSDLEANFGLGVAQAYTGKFEEARQSEDALRSLDEVKGSELASIIDKAEQERPKVQTPAPVAKQPAAKQPAAKQPAAKKPAAKAAKKAKAGKKKR